MLIGLVRAIVQRSHITTIDMVHVLIIITTTSGSARTPDQTRTSNPSEPYYKRSLR